MIGIPMERTLRIFTDGGCSGNPGPGGWAFVVLQEEAGVQSVLAENKGGEKNTTNNRMELLAVINALRFLEGIPAPRPSVLVLTDSQYVQKGISQWIRNWKLNGWRTSDRKPVKNKDLWMELDELAEGLSPRWQWVRGHAGVLYNERCDEMTQQAIAEVRG